MIGILKEWAWNFYKGPKKWMFCVVERVGKRGHLPEWGMFLALFNHLDFAGR